MKRARAILTLLITGSLAAGAEEFRHIGDFVIRSRVKVAEGRVLNVPIQPVRLSAFTDGITVRITLDGGPEGGSEYHIYRSDGISRQRGTQGAIEVIPGVQAMMRNEGELRQLRLTEETMTITSFPGISNQTTITHAVAAAPPKAVPAPTEVSAKTDP